MGPGSACAPVPEPFDFPAYLVFLKEHGHNFIRLWRWENFQSQAAGGGYHLCMSPQPWARTGPGQARDGQPKFDLEKFDPAYFERLRQRVAAAGQEGIYVAILLFDGWVLHLSPAPDNVAGHPCYGDNNINGVGISSIVDYQTLPLDPPIQAIQERYIRKVVDTLHDLPNVLWEVANESSGGGEPDREMAEALGLGWPLEWGDSTGWQYWVIDLVKSHELAQGYEPHPIGMTMQYPVADQRRVNDPLYQSAAEWISPGYDDEIFAGGGHPMAPNSPPSRWYDSPPANDGQKVIISDTDHYAPGRGDALWAWKSFLRGHHPILMDFGLIEGIAPTGGAADGNEAYASFEPGRYAMGDTRRYAEKMALATMAPRDELSSTGYALADPGREYLVLQAGDAAEPFTVVVELGSYDVEWHHLGSRRTAGGAEVMVASDAATTFRGPDGWSGPAVLYLRRAHTTSAEARQ
jgi:hypothetical protein